jgi:hypothetical protein
MYLLYSQSKAQAVSESAPFVTSRCVLWPHIHPVRGDTQTASQTVDSISVHHDATVGVLVRILARSGPGLLLRAEVTGVCTKVPRSSNSTMISRPFF